ncbi:Fic family protein [Leucobacter edaphi]|nr:Fic family protein [Leucobacter edaphi]
MSLPARITGLQFTLPPAATVASDKAVAAITRLDSEHGEHLEALAGLLLRAESVASSKTEDVEASAEDFARAFYGTKSNSSATSMVASTRALGGLITEVGGGGAITLESILDAHRVLMADDPGESHYAGQVRDMQNWIGGSDHSPRGASYVPPPAETVRPYLEDLLEFANRDDVPVLAQAAIIHAQFESIHPFTDGNGRIGRALINAVLRRRGVTTTVVVPLASALVAKKPTYFDLLAAFREGDAGPIIRAFSHAAASSAQQAVATARRLSELPAEWSDQLREATGRQPRAGSATVVILDLLLRTPFFTAEDMKHLTNASTTAVYKAIAGLTEAEILKPLTNKKRDQVWCAAAILEELNDLGTRIAAETNTDDFWLDTQGTVQRFLRSSWSIRSRNMVSVRQPSENAQGTAPSTE